MIMIIRLLYSIAIILESKPCIVFFSGGSNLISPNIYSNFLTRLHDEYKLYKIPFTFNNDKSKKFSEKLINILDRKYENIIFIGHSSGCTTAINKCNNKVNKLILLDPVKTPFYQSKKNLNYLEGVLFLNAENSYKWSKIPPFLPFIPFLKIKSQELIINKNKILCINIKNYGHSDILNNPWRNIMHYSRISIGNNKRSKKYINAYHKFLYEYINNFINKNSSISKNLQNNLYFI